MLPALSLVSATLNPQTCPVVQDTIPELQALGSALERQERKDEELGPFLEEADSP